jgi:hypothetical protein
MKVKTERIVAYGIVIILFVVGVVCYAAFPDTTPEEPLRIMFRGTAGNVFFDHKEHASTDGYGIECSDCHHDLEDEGDKPSACGECHEVDSEDEDAVERVDAFHAQCVECHEEDGSAPAECAGCHVFR